MDPRLCVWLSAPTPRVPGATSTRTFSGFWPQPTRKPASLLRLKRLLSMRGKQRTSKATPLWRTRCKGNLHFTTWVYHTINERKRSGSTTDSFLSFSNRNACAVESNFFFQPSCELWLTLCSRQLLCYLSGRGCFSELSDLCVRSGKRTNGMRISSPRDVYRFHR